ncbi:MAG TPA: hypothetical protein VEQ65_09660, partial [Opitutus sp.]|nr:hypothetical protein [Opitutus sp.]
AQAFHARFGKKIHSFYGSTETGGITYDRSGQASLSARSVGRPLEGVQIAFERRGRFRVTSAAVHTLGNRQRVGRLGSYRPLDLAELTPDGELVLVARAGRVVKIAGRRVNLAEVEHALRQIPGVRDAFATTHPERSDALAAAVVSERPSVELRAALAGLLAAWKIPRKLVSLAEFPINARGKTDARRLQEILGQNA